MPPNKKAAPARTAFQQTFKMHYKNSGITYQAVSRAAIQILPALLSRWLPDGILRGNEYMARNPRRTDNKPGSFAVNIITGRWADFATGDKGGDVISLAAYLFEISQSEARNRISKMLGA